MLYEVITRRRVADQVEKAVDFAVAQRRTMLVRLQLGGEREVLDRPAHRADQFVERSPRSRARIADIDRITSYNVCYTKLLRPFCHVYACHKE